MTPRRAAFYARVSTDNHDQSPENQLTELRRFAAAQNWPVVAEYVDYDPGSKSARCSSMRKVYKEPLQPQRRPCYDHITTSEARAEPLVLMLEGAGTACRWPSVPDSRPNHGEPTEFSQQKGRQTIRPWPKRPIKSLFWAPNRWPICSCLPFRGHLRRRYSL